MDRRASEVASEVEATRVTSSRRRLSRGALSGVVLLAVLLIGAGGPFLPAPIAGAASAAEAESSDEQLPDLPDENAAARQKAEGVGGTTGPALQGAEAPPDESREPEDQGVVEYDDPAGPTPAARATTDGPYDEVATQKGEREVLHLRTERSRTFQNPDGTLRTEVGSGPMHMAMPDGSLQPIDTTLAPTGAATADDDRAGRERAGGRRPRRSRRSPTPVEVAQEASDPTLAAVELDADTRIAFSLRGAARVPSRVDRNKARFDRVMPGVDVELEARASGLKETIVLHSRDVPNEFVYDLALRGLDARLDAGTGDIELRDRSGKVRARIPRGTVWDSSSPARPSSEPDAAPVRYHLRGNAGRQQLVMTLERAWLTDPARVFPVFLDPQVQNGTVSQDTYVSTCSVDANVHLDGRLRVGGGPDASGPGCNRNPLIKWDPNLPAGALVLNAHIAL